MRYIGLFFLCIASCLFGDDDGSDIVTLTRSETVIGDYFAYGKSVEVSGTVQGDLYVFGAQVYIDGTVEGDIIVSGGSVTIAGRGEQDLRLLAGQVMMSGSIGGNATVVAGNVELFPSSSVGGNLVALAGNVDLGASVGRNSRINASNVRISGDLGGNLKAYVGQMRFSPHAKVRGEVEYWSNKLAHVADDAALYGGITHHPSFFFNLFQGNFFQSIKIGSKLATLLMNFFYSFIIGLIFIRFFPQNIFRSIEAIEKRPMYALLAGVMTVVILPLAFLILLITILGAPFALTLLAINVIGLYTAKVITIFFIISKVLKKIDFKRHLRLYFFLGLSCYFALVLLPFVGQLVSIAAALFGFGGIVLGKMPQTIE